MSIDADASDAREWACALRGAAQEQEIRDMEKYTLTRTGNTPITFEGEELVSVGGKWQAGREQNRWHNLVLYRTAKGTLVLEIVYNTNWEGEDPRYYAAVVDDYSALAEEVKAYSPSDDVRGFPDRPQYAERQASLVDHITRMWESRMTDFLTKAADEIGAAEQIE